MAGGEERVLTLKANYLADVLGYDVTIILTEGNGQPLFYTLSERVHTINLDIDFEALWTCSFLQKIPTYIKKQHRYKQLLAKTLKELRPDITISMMRREINFLTSIDDGSHKIGEIHVNRDHFRNFEGKPNVVKRLFAFFWQRSLIKHLKQLDKFVVLTDEDARLWPELSNVITIPDMLSFVPKRISPMTRLRLISVGRYCYQKGFDLLLEAWAVAQNMAPQWRLDIYGDGDREPYERIIDDLKIDRSRCELHGRTQDIESEFVNSSLSVCSSRFEGFGLVIVEAMACGLPVVAFDCPWGPRSIITDGNDGVLVEDGNVRKLADAMLAVISDNERRKQMGIRAVENIRRFGVDAIANKWKELFDELN
jgi:glycosyltransferase involved in cell wall biosynthesis